MPSTLDSMLHLGYLHCRTSPHPLRAYGLVLSRPPLSPHGAPTKLILALHQVGGLTPGFKKLKKFKEMYTGLLLKEYNPQIGSILLAGPTRGGGIRVKCWTSMPALFCNFIVHQTGLNPQKSQTHVLRGGMYGNGYNLGMAAPRKQVQQSGSKCSGMSHLSSEARLQTTAFSPKRLAVEVGALLKIDLSGTKAGIKAIVGDNLEEISLQPLWIDSSDESAKYEALNISHSPDRVSLEKSEPLDQHKIQLTRLLELKVAIPARWCSLDVQTSEGPVSVQNVREGSVRVTTAGGDVNLGEVKGGKAFIETHGGEFQAKILQAGSCISTEGGKLYVDKLQGDIVELDSGGGRITIGTLYGNDVTVQSHGGSLKARHLQAQKRAQLSSDGGPITINGFDGNGVFVSKGGRIELQLSEHAQEVIVDAADGDVILFLSAKLIAQLKYEGPQGPVQHENILKPSEVPNVYHYAGSESGSRKLGHNLGWRGSENDTANAERDTVLCKIVVSTAGKVVVKQKGWLDLI